MSKHQFQVAYVRHGTATRDIIIGPSDVGCEIFRALNPEFPGFEAAALRLFTVPHNIASLVHMSSYKRSSRWRHQWTNMPSSHAFHADA